MTTIYIVTSGVYSDYSIDAVFSTEEKAKDYITKRKIGKIEEWELDAEETARTATTVLMCRDGSVQYYYASVHSRKLAPFYFVISASRGEQELVLVCEVETDDLTRAIKVMNERRVAIIAAEQWGINQQGVEAG